MTKVQQVLLRDVKNDKYLIKNAKCLEAEPGDLTNDSWDFGDETFINHGNSRIAVEPIHFSSKYTLYT